MNIKKLREKAGLTQEQARSELKFKSGGIINISLRTLQYWEQNPEKYQGKAAFDFYVEKVLGNPQKKLSDEMSEILHDLPGNKQSGFKAAIRFIRERGL